LNFKKAAPYFGIGYGRPINSGLSLIFDLGVMFQGSPKSKIDVTCGPAAHREAPTAQPAKRRSGRAGPAERERPQFQVLPGDFSGLAYTF